MNKIISLIITIVIILTIVPELSFGQSSSRSKWVSRSFDMGVTDRGFTAGATWKYGWNRDWRSPAQFAFLFFRESDNVPYRDPYTGYYYNNNRDSKKILFLNLRTGIERRLWSESLAENLQPHLVLSLGPTLAINPVNEGKFFQRWKKTTFDATGHIFAGANVDFVYSKSAQFSVGVGYEVIYFPHIVDGTDNYSGVAVTLSFGERL